MELPCTLCSKNILFHERLREGAASRPHLAWLSEPPPDIEYLKTALPVALVLQQVRRDAQRKLYGQLFNSILSISLRNLHDQRYTAGKMAMYLEQYWFGLKVVNNRLEA